MRFLRNLSLSNKIAAANLVGLGLLAAALLFLYQSAMSGYAAHQAQKYQESAMRVAWDVLRQYGDGFKIVDDKLVAGARPLNDFFEPVDRIKDLMGGTATVFMGDLRIATNVKKPDGSRAVGTRLAPGPVFDAVLKRGETYRGKADILGRSYYTAYDPIKDASGAVIGVLYVGVPESEFAAELEGVQQWAGLVALVLAIAIGAAMYVLSRRMFAPLAHLAAAMARISAGDLTEPAPHGRRTDDIGRMARAVEVFRQTGIAKLELDAEAERHRAEVERERQQNDRLRTASSEEQTCALGRLAEALKRIADGDLSERLDDGFSAAYQPIRDDFNAAIDELSSALSGVASSAGEIRHGMDSLSAASVDLSRRSSEQAASLQEIVAAIASVTDTIRKSADGAKRSHATVAATAEGATRSAEVVREAVEAIHEIATSARQIGATISVIDEIAFQTNLLALNAGVEAARAGDAGRGFAVVASEVRALAQRSAEAAKEIKALIRTSEIRVENGVKLVGETGKSLQRIIGEVTEISQTASEIADAAIQGAAGLEQIDVSIRTMDDVTQKNAAMAERSTQACEQLAGDAERLAALIDRFRLQGAREARRRAA